MLPPCNMKFQGKKTGANLWPMLKSIPKKPARIAIVQNLLTPLLGLLIPDSTFAEWAPGGFGIGAVINSIISFIITAFVVFLLVKGVNKLTHLKKQEEQAQEPEEPAGPTTEELLTEIRDLLKEQK